MTLTEKDVKHVAALARIELSDDMREKMQEDLSSILGYVEKLSAVPTEQVEPLYQVTGLTDRLRDDVHRDDFPMNDELDGRLPGQAPARSGRFVKVKGVLKK